MLERLWAGWRSEYVSTADEKNREGCVFCGLVAEGVSDEDARIVWRGSRCVALLNAYPYASGHLMVMPVRHLSDVEQLTLEETAELWAGVTTAVVALKAAYRPEGVNIGANIGRAAGAGIPNHFHVHAVPRWVGDTNFMTAVADARVLPEALAVSWERLRAAWPASAG